MNSLILETTYWAEEVLTFVVRVVSHGEEFFRENESNTEMNSNSEV